MNQIYPLKTYLHIFQLEGYSPIRFLKWFITHPFVRTTTSKKPLVWTSKAKWLYYLSVKGTISVSILLFIFAPLKYALPISILLILFPFIQLILALFVMKPYEIWNKAKTIERTQKKIKSLKNVTVIGITGSYGKTSVKEMLHHILSSKYRVLKTPKSYNTVFGIAKVVDMELDNSYDFFISEMGAYKRGDIKELCDMVMPTHGILTGIAEQHLDRFGSLTNIIKGKFELIESLPEKGIALLNGDNEHIVGNLSKVQKNYELYGLNNSNLSAKAEDITLTNQGTTFTLVIGNKKKKAKTSLLGNSSIQNILGASLMAYKLGMTLDEIVSSIETLPAVPNRLQLMHQGKTTIINDAYNSNPKGFAESIETASLFKNKNKILVTPGIVDLGSRNDQIHFELGKKAAGVFEHIILVTESIRTKALAKGILDAGFNKSKLHIVKDLNTARLTLEKIESEDNLILFENDLPDNY